MKQESMFWYHVYIAGRSGNLSSYALIQFAIYFLHGYSSYHGWGKAQQLLLKRWGLWWLKLQFFLLWRQRNKRNNVLHNQESIKVISLFRVINHKCVTGFLFFFSVESTILYWLPVFSLFLPWSSVRLGSYICSFIFHFSMILTYFSQKEK